MRLASALLCALVFAQPASARLWAVDEPPPSPDGVLVLQWPAQGTITDGFGPRWGRMHLGLDIGTLRTLDLRAAASGTVERTGWLAGYEGYGQVVVVDVGDGYETMYAHLSRIDVKPGAILSAVGTPSRRGRRDLRVQHGLRSARAQTQAACPVRREAGEHLFHRLFCDDVTGHAEA